MTATIRAADAADRLEALGWAVRVDEVESPPYLRATLIASGTPGYLIATWSSGRAGIIFCGGQFSGAEGMNRLGEAAVDRLIRRYEKEHAA